MVNECSICSNTFNSTALKSLHSKLGSLKRMFLVFIVFRYQTKRFEFYLLTDSVVCHV